MGSGEGRRHGQPVKQQGPLGFAGQVPHQRRQDDETDFEEQRQADQKRRDQDGPHGAFGAEFFEQPVRQHAPAAGVLQETADHGAQPDHHGNEAQGVAKSAAAAAPR